MAYADKGHRLTDAMLADLEKRINGTYDEAAREMEETAWNYLVQFQARDRQMAARLANGEITDDYYKRWRLNQIGRGERYQAMADKLSRRATQANQVAMAYINDSTPGIYSLNHNYQAFRIEASHPGVDYTLYNEQAIKHMTASERVKTMPNYPQARAVQRGIDIDFGQKMINKAVTSGILQGKSIRGIADDLQHRVTTMNRTSAIRAARTATTEAENAGRTAAMQEAEKMGIKITRMWVASKDSRTRPDHGLLDGQKVGADEPFVVPPGGDFPGEELMYPGDPMGIPALVYNCRCSIRTVEKDGIEKEPRMTRVRDPKTGKNVVVPAMNYEQWAKWKESGKSYAEWSGTGYTPTNTPQGGTTGGTITVGDLNSAPKVDLSTLSTGAQRIITGCEASGVAQNAVSKYTGQRTDADIISRLAGGDRTDGSCVSVGIAYIGQKLGLDVLDFRGGDSCRFFSHGGWARLADMVSKDKVIRSGKKTAVVNAREMLNKAEVGKQYAFCVGHHFSIVRRDAEEGLQYLEMQSPSSNGWTNFVRQMRWGNYTVDDTLKHRFGCSGSAGLQYMIDISEFRADDMQEVLKYINTNTGEQQKGANGVVR